MSRSGSSTRLAIVSLIKMGSRAQKNTLTVSFGFPARRLKDVSKMDLFSFHSAE